MKNPKALTIDLAVVAAGEHLNQRLLDEGLAVIYPPSQNTTAF